MIEPPLLLKLKGNDLSWRIFMLAEKRGNKFDGKWLEVSERDELHMLPSFPTLRFFFNPK
jgi:hypothetical protein